MRTFWSTGAGALIGLTGGLWGLGFGLIMGFLVDLVAAELRVQRETRRYLETGTASLWLSPLLPLTGAVAGAVTPSAVLSSRLIAAIEQRLADVRADRFAARLSERSIAAAAGLDRNAVAADLLAASPLESRKRVCRTVWEALRDEQVPRVAFERLTTLAQEAGIDPGFVERELPVRMFLDEHACAVLGVGPDAAADEVRHAYRRLAAQFHPDTATTLSEEQQQASAEAFVRIRGAYETLMRQIAGPGER